MEVARSPKHWFPTTYLQGAVTHTTTRSVQVVGRTFVGYLNICEGPLCQLIWL